MLCKMRGDPGKAEDGLKKIEVTTVYAVVYRAAVRWKCIAHKAKYYSVSTVSV